jgi:hypothetical protein
MLIWSTLQRRVASECSPILQEVQNYKKFGNWDHPLKIRFFVERADCPGIYFPILSTPLIFNSFKAVNPIKLLIEGQ